MFFSLHRKFHDSFSLCCWLHHKLDMFCGINQDSSKTVIFPHNMKRQVVSFTLESQFYYEWKNLKMGYGTTILPLAWPAWLAQVLILKRFNLELWLSHSFAVFTSLPEIHLPHKVRTYIIQRSHPVSFTSCNFNSLGFTYCSLLDIFLICFFWLLS
jgi:hypothetical protein